MDILSSLGPLLGLTIVGGGFAAIFQRFTKRKRVQSAKLNKSITEENEHLRHLLTVVQEETQLGTWYWDLQTRKTSWSEELYLIFELPRDERPSLDHIRSIIVEEDKQLFEDIIEECLAGNMPSRIQYRIKTNSGKLKYLSSKGQVIYDNDKPAKILGTVQDITEEVETNEVIVETNNNFRVFTETLPLAIYKTNFKGDILYVNSAMVEMFGYESAEELKQYKTDDLYVNPKERHYILAELLDKGKVLDHRVTFKRKDGRTFIGSNNSHANGNELQGIIQDTSERSKHEHENIKLIHQLKAKNEDLEKFAHIVSHNLRRPLVNLAGLAQVLDRESLNSQNSEIIQLMELSLTNLDVMIRDLNTIIQIRDKRSEHYENVNLNEMIQSLQNQYREQFGANHAEFITNIESDDVVYTIPKFLTNIMLNLIDNAIKFRHADRTPKIEVSFAMKSETFELVINDNGIGFDIEANRDRLFRLYEKFYPNEEGRGVGLYMVYNYVNVLGGEVYMDSEPDKGTKVHLYFPKKYCYVEVT